jgi:hypothetical protein
LNGLTNILNSLKNLTNEQFASERASQSQQISSHLDSLKQSWSPFVSALVEKQGLLSENLVAIVDNIRKEREETVEALGTTFKELTSLQKSEVESLRSQVRETAKGISIEQAQKQFDNARSILWNRARGWALLSAVSFICFFWFATYILNHTPAALFGGQLQIAADAVKATSQAKGVSAQIPIPLIVAQTAYLAAIRITILTAIGALATFCLRMMRSSLHMAEHNDHRRRLANSMASFVAAASTPEQRDSILATLVGAVSQFGDTGLLNDTKDAVSVPSIAIEAITKNLTQAK